MATMARLTRERRRVDCPHCDMTVPVGHFCWREDLYRARLALEVLAEDAIERRLAESKAKEESK